MVFGLIDFAFVDVKLLIVKICEIIGPWKSDFLRFSWKQSVKQNRKLLKTIENLLAL